MVVIEVVLDSFINRGVSCEINSNPEKMFFSIPE